MKGLLSMVGAIVPLAVGACGSASIPQSVQMYAAELPARADGQYAALPPEIQKQLVLKDAVLQCSIDTAGDKKETDSAACACAKSSSDVWTNDCRGWLGAHTPAPEAASQPSASSQP